MEGLVVIIVIAKSDAIVIEESKVDDDLKVLSRGIIASLFMQVVIGSALEIVSMPIQHAIAFRNLVDVVVDEGVVNFDLILINVDHSLFLVQMRVEIIGDVQVRT